MASPVIVVCNSMAKSGSTLLCHYARQLINHQYPDNGQLALCETIRAGRIKGDAHVGTRVAGAFITRIGEEEMAIISEIAAKDGPVVIKTHGDTDPTLVKALQDGRMRMTFTHRDPRDMILSAMDHCVQTRDTDSPSLQEFTSVRNGMVSTRWWAQLACNWVDSGLTHVTLYTDLVSEPVRTLARMADYLGVQITPELLEAMVNREKQSRKIGLRRFNRGELHRYSKEMSPEDLAYCNEELGDLITHLGYPL